MSQMIMNNTLIDSIDVFDIIRSIKDPEFPNTLEELNVVNEDLITVDNSTENDYCTIKIYFTPTVPHCHLAPTIGLCIREKLNLLLPKKSKIEILIKPGTHQTEDTINKQVNDKERYIAAMENKEIKKLVLECIEETE
ncbi:hypothetical protein CYY_004735 [Polysphondylium violaceum]|uniref:MIP18 family-like domain-containing protein n=1 Tax=Polysphondylium violaceum TaxID=133409 RepID=A0A8J4V052_9MYCE|nr:hypothetical protein CYY_004735 [Polysphondylium violaceum]